MRAKVQPTEQLQLFGTVQNKTFIADLQKT